MNNNDVDYDDDYDDNDDGFCAKHWVLTEGHGTRSVDVVYNTRVWIWPSYSKTESATYVCKGNWSSYLVKYLEERGILELE